VFQIGSAHAPQTLRFIEDPRNRDGEGFLVLGDGRVGGFSNERRVHAERFDPGLQWRHSRHFPSVGTACGHVPGFKAIVDGVHRQLPETHAEGRRIVPLHANYIDQSSKQTRQAEHDDLDEDLAPDGGRRDRVVRYTGIVSLAGGRTSVRVAGKEEVFYGSKPGSGILFRSALKHETVAAGKGIRKLTIFFGWMLETPSSALLLREAASFVERRRYRGLEDALAGGEMPMRLSFQEDLGLKAASPPEVEDAFARLSECESMRGVGILMLNGLPGVSFSLALRPVVTSPPPSPSQGRMGSSSERCNSATRAEGGGMHAGARPPPRPQHTDL